MTTRIVNLLERWSLILTGIFLFVVIVFAFAGKNIDFATACFCLCLVTYLSVAVSKYFIIGDD